VVNFGSTLGTPTSTLGASMILGGGDIVPPAQVPSLASTTVQPPTALGAPQTPPHNSPGPPLPVRRVPGDRPVR
jgi:hypothetical protein